VNLFADSSALAKRYIADEKSDQLDELLRTSSSLAVSVLCIPEIVSALCRRHRERFLTNRQYESAKAALEKDLADATVIALIDEVLLGSITLLEVHPLRASDALQISSALVWHAEMFVSADARQCAAANTAGLRVMKL
jgi:hypothetical protein